MRQKFDLLLTRHQGLIDWLIHKKIVSPEIKVLPHAAYPEVVKDLHVIGVAPLWLAAECKSFTEIRLDIPSEARGKELSMDDLDKYIHSINTYYNIQKNTVYKASRELFSAR